MSGSITYRLYGNAYSVTLALSAKFIADIDYKTLQFCATRFVPIACLYMQFSANLKVSLGNCSVRFMTLAMSQTIPESTKLCILVVDDHEIVLGGTIDLLKQHYPQAEILTAQTVDSALSQVKLHMPDLIVLDLSLPATSGSSAQAESGVQLLKTLMQTYPTLNLTVQSTHVKALVRIRPEIDRHKAGFTVADKNLSSKEMLTRVDWALKGITHTKDIRRGRTLEVKPDWITVLKLAFHEGLQDRAIAKRMQVSERTVRHYWTKIQDVLEVYPDEDKQDGKNIRIQTEIRAREEGLID